MIWHHTVFSSLKMQSLKPRLCPDSNVWILIFESLSSIMSFSSNDDQQSLFTFYGTQWKAFWHCVVRVMWGHPWWTHWNTGDGSLMVWNSFFEAWRVDKLQDQFQFACTQLRGVALTIFIFNRNTSKFNILTPSILIVHTSSKDVQTTFSSEPDSLRPQTLKDFNWKCRLRPSFWICRKSDYCKAMFRWVGCHKWRLDYRSSIRQDSVGRCHTVIDRSIFTSI